MPRIRQFSHLINPFHVLQYERQQQTAPAAVKIIAYILSGNSSIGEAYALKVGDLPCLHQTAAVSNGSLKKQWRDLAFSAELCREARSVYTSTNLRFLPANGTIEMLTCLGVPASPPSRRQLCFGLSRKAVV